MKHEVDFGIEEVKHDGDLNNLIVFEVERLPTRQQNRLTGRARRDQSKRTAAPHWSRTSSLRGGSVDWPLWQSMGNRYSMVEDQRLPERRQLRSRARVELGERVFRVD